MRMRAWLGRVMVSRSFTARLLAFAMVMVLLLSGASVLAVVYVAGASLDSESQGQATSEASTVTQLLADHRTSLLAFVTGLAADPSAQSDLAQATPESAQRQLERLTPPSAGVVVALLAPDGAPLAVRGAPAAFDAALLGRMPSARTAEAGHPGSGFDPLGTGLATAAAAPVGSPVGAVVVAAEPLNASLASRIAAIVGDGVSVVVGGRRMAASPDLAPGALPSGWAAAIRSGADGRMVLTGTDGGVRRIAVASALHSSDGTVAGFLLVERPTAAAEGLLSVLARALVLVTFVIAAFGLLVLAFFTRVFLDQPIKRLSAEVRRITDGDLAHPVQPARVIEFDQLARGIDHMRAELARHLRQVELRGLISRNLHQRSGLDTQLQRVVTLASEMMGARQALLITHVVGVGGFDFTISHGFPEEPDRLWLLSDHGLVPRLLRAREGGFRNDIPAVEAGELERWLPARNCLVVPLVLGEQHRGALYFFNKDAGFNEEDQRLAEGLAEEIVIAFEKSMLLVVSQRQATTDPLTGLYNYRFLTDYLEHALRLGRLNQPVALLMMDLDRFKALNDEHGHLVGDQALKLFASALLNCVRGSDLAARYGGEEFAVVMPDTTLEQAEVVAEKVRDTVARMGLEVSPGRRITFTVSIGGAVRYPTQPGDSDESGAFVDRADQALYRAKRLGRDRVVFAPSHVHALPAAR
jgi:diguanylate cyclase (GGDEF)-like protein